VPELVKALGIAPSRAERRQSTGKLQLFTGGGSGVARANLEIAALRGSARWSAFAGRLKKQILELLERDLEFRYAVAGYLGLSEVLRRLDSIEESIKKLWESQNRLWENANKLWEEVKALREGQEKLWLEVKALREGQDRLWEGVGALNVRVARVERTLEKLTLDVEEEARIVVEHRLREMGYELKVVPLILPEVEVDIYGATGDLCVVGEARVRASSRALDELNEKVELLKRISPDKLRPRLLKVVYTSQPMLDLIERAEREGLWVLKAAGDVAESKV